MNIQQYYEAIRAIENDIAEADVWVASLESGNGGVAGRLSEVPKRIAAKMILDGNARKADATEIGAELNRLTQERKRQSNSFCSSYQVLSGDEE